MINPSLTVPWWLLDSLWWLICSYRICVSWRDIRVSNSWFDSLLFGVSGVSGVVMRSPYIVETSQQSDHSPYARTSMLELVQNWRGIEPAPDYRSLRRRSAVPIGGSTSSHTQNGFVHACRLSLCAATWKCPLMVLGEWLLMILERCVSACDLHSYIVDFIFGMVFTFVLVRGL